MIYSNKLKNWDFANAEHARFDSKKTCPLLDIETVFSGPKMACSAKGKTNSSACLGITIKRKFLSMLSAAVLSVFLVNTAFSADTISPLPPSSSALSPDNSYHTDESTPQDSPHASRKLSHSPEDTNFQELPLATIKNGHTVYPPSYAFVEILQKSGYLFKPETERYLQHSYALVFHAMTPYYVVQRNNSSCSLATATMLLNTVREIQAHHHLDKPATQNEVLEMVNNPLWDVATADDGPGVANLEQFGQFLKEMFLAYKIEGISVDVIQIKDKSEETRQLIHQDLEELENESCVTTLLALNFDDRCFINSHIEMGHISPVGGYDTEARLVLILDVDRDWTGPYWLTEETMLNGLNTIDKDENTSTSTHRGYIRLRVKSDS